MSIAIDRNIQVPESLYTRTTNYLKSWVHPSTLDNIELVATSVFGACMLKLCADWSFLGINYYSPHLTIFGAFAAWILYNKNIKCPSIKNQIENISANSKNSSKAMALFFSTHDLLNALTNHSTLSRVQSFAKDHSIDLIKIDKMEFSEKRYDTVVIIGHSSSKQITLAKGMDISQNGTWDPYWFRDHVKVGSKIMIIGCRAASGNNSVSRWISECCPQAKVYASTTYVNVFHGIELDEEQNPKFYSGFLWKGKDSTRIFQNGQLLSPVAKV